MPSQEVDLEITMYGNLPSTFPYSAVELHQVKLLLRPRLPSPNMSLQEIAMWVSRFMIDQVKDIRHTQKWRCKYCNKPSREVQYQMCVWGSATSPIFKIWVHQMCDTNTLNKCSALFREDDNEICATLGQPPNNQPRRTHSLNLPLCATCAGCTKEEAGATNRCAGCKVTIYCSRKCQKSDWLRHKPFCKSVRNINWDRLE